MRLRMMLKMLAYAEFFVALSDKADVVVMHAMLILLGVHDVVCVLSSVRL